MFGLDTGSPAQNTPVTFSKIRLYAQGVDDVAGLTDWMAERNIDSSSRLAEIDSVKAINQVLTLIFSVIALTALIGCVASLVGAFLANIDRKRKDMAVLRLLGFTSIATAAYVVIQALIITVLAYVVGLALYAIASELFNQLLVGNQSTSDFSCEISVMHAVLALLFAVIVAVFVSSIGALRAIGIEPAESLREL